MVAPRESVLKPALALTAAAAGMYASIYAGLALAAQQPIIFDVYSEDDIGPFEAAAGDPRCVGGYLKASEGVNYAPAWFVDNWTKLRAAAPERHGVSWFRGAYHFLRAREDGGDQADAFVAQLARAGGLAGGDFAPMVDVELEEHTGGNMTASAQQWIDTTSAFAERVKALLGRPVVLYANTVLHERSITDHMGCEWLWPARYTATLPRSVYEDVGWSRWELFAWQYAGDGSGSLAGYPTSIAGFGTVDLSVMQLNPLTACLPNAAIQIGDLPRKALA